MSKTKLQLVDAPENGEVAPLLEEPSRELVDLKAIEAECIELAKATVIHSVSIANELHDDLAVRVRNIRGKREELLTSKEYVMSRLGTICAALDAGIADCDVALDYITNGIGQAAA